MHKKLLKSIKANIKDFDIKNKERYLNRADKENIFPIGISDKEFIEIITNIFLGKDWCVVAPLSHNQINEVILDNIIAIIEKK